MQLKDVNQLWKQELEAHHLPLLQGDPDGTFSLDLFLPL